MSHEELYAWCNIDSKLAREVSKRVYYYIYEVRVIASQFA